MKVAVYPGSFDPITFGHIDIALRALKVFDKLIILINVHPTKAALFSAEERKDMVEEVMKDHLDKITVIAANDLLSLTNLARMVGGKPLDEAIALDAKGFFPGQISCPLIASKNSRQLMSFCRIINYQMKWSSCRSTS